MKQERVILSFIMVLIGLLVAGVAFYFYQTGKQTKPNLTAIISPTLSSTKPTQNNLVLEVLNPQNEFIVSNKILSLTGKANPEATVIIITNSDQQIVKPSDTGIFNATITLSNDQNLISVISILPNGDNKQIQETVTYSTSNF